MRAINFSAGPAGLPLPALELAKQELLDFEGSGMSIMEQSHRGKQYDAVHAEAEALLRGLLGVPDQDHVLFLQGGASQQFATVPLNLLRPGASADYILTGGWSEKALEEAQRIGAARVAASTRQADGRYTRIPAQAELDLDPGAAYVHMTTNNTLFGSQWHGVPDVGDVPLVADMSSDFLWKPTDIAPYSLIYAGAQKNLGPSGVVIVVVKQALLARMRDDIPVIWRYSTHAKAKSLYHTPPTFAVYMVRNVLRWLRDIGGLAEVERRNREKARLLYAAIDAQPDLYQCPVEVADRSTMNVVFRLPTEGLESLFVKGAEAAGMVGLRGHRSVGGLRASLYNAVSVEDVDALTAFMGDFARQHTGA
jgi:phosphoserine aminotransferase